MLQSEGEVLVHRIGFVLTQNFSMIAFAAAVDPLRLANSVSRHTHYDWTILSLDGAPVIASNGIKITVDGDLESVGRVETIFVCSGVDVEDFSSKYLLSWLRRHAAHGIAIGALCSGAYILARAGLLDNDHCTIHWENEASFKENFPEISLTNELFEVSGLRYTSAGGTAVIDMMLHLITMQIGGEVAALVSDELIHHRIREGVEPQRMDLRTRIGVSHPKLLGVVSSMEENLETPISGAQLATDAGLSSRQLERLFQKYLHTAPNQYYLRLRINRSRFLLRQTSLSILSITMATGFISASHFSKCYREHFGCTPSYERRIRMTYATSSNDVEFTA